MYQETKANKDDEAKTKNDEGKEKSSTKIILHKIAFGDMGVAVTVNRAVAPSQFFLVDLS